MYVCMWAKLSFGGRAGGDGVDRNGWWRVRWWWCSSCGGIVAEGRVRSEGRRLEGSRVEEVAGCRSQVLGLRCLVIHSHGRRIIRHTAQ